LVSRNRGALIQDSLLLSAEKSGIVVRCTPTFVSKYTEEPVLLMQLPFAATSLCLIHFHENVKPSMKIVPCAVAPYKHWQNIIRAMPFGWRTCTAETILELAQRC
jgi:hypothetical protein